MPTEEINILNIDVEPSQPEGFDVQLDLQEPNTPILNLGVVLPIGQGGGAIKSISKNGIELPIIEGNVDIEVPTKTSELVNDSNFVASNELSSVAFSGDYDDLENKPEIEEIATNVANSIVSTHNQSETSHSDIRNEIETVKDIAEGANIAIVFDSYSDLVTFFNNESDSLKVGTNLYVKTVEVPDLWISAVEETTVSYTYTTDEDFLSYINGNGQIGYYKFSELETQKVDLSNYATLTDLGTKVSKSGDTMTGDLNMTNSAVVLSSSQSSAYKWDIASTSNNLVFTRMNLDGSTRTGRLSLSTDATFRRYVYVNWSATEDNRLLPHSEIDNPTTSSSVTLVGGITHFNELGTVDYSTITLPSSPGTAEYNGTFTSSTAGDITISLPLTYWSGETNIVAGRTYSFSIQNGVGFIIQMN